MDEIHCYLLLISYYFICTYYGFVLLHCKCTSFPLLIYHAKAAMFYFVLFLVVILKKMLGKFEQKCKMQTALDSLQYSSKTPNASAGIFQQEPEQVPKHSAVQEYATHSEE